MSLLATYPTMTLWKQGASGMPFFFRPKHYFGAMKTRYKASHVINRAFRWTLPISFFLGYTFANKYTDAEKVVKHEELVNFGKVKLAY